MNVVLTAEAAGDLDRIASYIAAENPARALSFVLELRQRCEGLAHTPKAFPVLARYEHSGVRRLVHGNYLIFYVVGETDIAILHILHGAMDYEAVLFPSR